MVKILVAQFISRGFNTKARAYPGKESPGMPTSMSLMVPESSLPVRPAAMSITPSIAPSKSVKPDC